MNCDCVTKEWLIKFVAGFVVAYCLFPIVAYVIFCIVTETIPGIWRNRN